jgi:V8-like Glu-specific endopeptidase
MLTLTKGNAAIGLNAIYRQDNRQFVGPTSSATIKKLSKSIAMIINKDSLHGLKIETTKLSDANGLNICADEKFSESYSVASCTGFLIATDLLVTAGHCIQDFSDCQDKLIIFDILESTSSKSGYKVGKKNIFACKELVTQDSMGDFAIIRLDRKSIERNTLKLSTRGSIGLNEKVMMLGHPMGIPLMLSNNAQVRETSDDTFFYADLDSFVGNSGSPVFNSRTFEVEGMLVKGQDDFEFDNKTSCNHLKVYSPSSQSAETVTRISLISKAIKPD